MRHRHLLFYKPYNVLCQFTGEAPTLRDFITAPNVYPAGRLDRDSEGLLLLTSDGALQHRLTDPRHGHPRTYWAQVEGAPTREVIAALSNGVRISGKDGSFHTRPATVSLLPHVPELPPRDPPVRFRKAMPTAWLELTLTEGRNRQIRRMTAAVGLPTLRLVRIATGHLTLSGLLPGQWRDLTPDELNDLWAVSSRKPA
jgi:23S rRNA pseudouridine2457 synthase